MQNWTIQSRIVYRDEPQREDRELLAAVVRSSGFFSPEEVALAVELFDERLEKGLACGYHFLLAHSCGELLGYTCFGPIPCTRSSYDLYWIAVGESFRGRGAGSRLLGETELRIASLGGTRIYVETSARPQYEPTRLFYQAQGYLRDAVLRDFYAPGEAKEIYVKSLG